MSIATSILSPRSHRQGKVVTVDPMYLDEIPGAMDKMGWRVSAALMRRWFATKPAWVMSPAERADPHLDPTTLPASRVESRLVTMHCCWASIRLSRRSSTCIETGIRLLHAMFF